MQESKHILDHQLGIEAKLLKRLEGGVGNSIILGVPNIYYYGEEGDFYVLAEDLYGPNLEDLFNFSGRTFSLKTGTIIAQQLVQHLSDSDI